MATRNRITRTRKAPKANDAETQAATDAAADIKETAEEQAEQPQPTPETATAEQPQPTPEPTDEEIKAAETKAEEERFAADVETAESDLVKANHALMPVHMTAVESKAAVDNALDTWRNKNADSIKTMDGCQVRLAAARTALLNEWRPLATENQETTTVEVEDAQKPDIVYFNALGFGFDAGVADNVQGPEKEYWLAAQSFIRVKKAMTAEPDGIAQLRETATANALAYNWAQAVYDKALANKIEG